MQAHVSGFIFVLMEPFVVSARKYRPQAFESVVGQQHITTSLLNAVNNDQLGQALLFTGPRGVGKTTCARILAKIINRTSEDDQTDYSLNVFELDAASNNSVNDVRELTEQVRYAPPVGRYKVYIIDEVHMLSQGAFNAFLKTLEEPPEHAIFILATTEKHKILPTILSRCQIYDFRRITVDDIKNHLVYVAQQEGVNTDNQSLHLIAQKADGALRDALSIFDRVSSFTQKNIHIEATTELLNVLDYNYYFRITDALLCNDGVTAITILSEIVDRGFDMHLFIGGLASHLRNVWMCKDNRTLHLLNASKDLEQMYAEQAAKCNSTWLVHALKLLQDADLSYKRSQNAQLLTELTVLRLAHHGQSEEKKNDKPPVKQLIDTSTPSNPVDNIKSDNRSAQSVQSAVVSQKATSTNDPQNTHQNSQNAPPILDAENSNTSTDPETKSQSKPDNQNVGSTPKATPSAPRRGFSIASRMQSANTQKEEATEKETERVAKSEGFSLNADHLQQFYRLFVQSKDDGNHTLLFNTLQSLKPDKRGDYGIHFTLHSETQRTILAECQSEMMMFLREKLGHGAIELNIDVVQHDPGNKIKTPKEKLSKLIEEQPLTQKLIDKLDLKLDY